MSPNDAHRIMDPGQLDEHLGAFVFDPSADGNAPPSGSRGEDEAVREPLLRDEPDETAAPGPAAPIWAPTRLESFRAGGRDYPRYINEFWTARQRQASPLHEISYRACFKPQLPRFFIERLTRPGDVVYDPFSGRGTTAIEAALLGRNFIANDINPLSQILTEPRLKPPGPEEVRRRLEAIRGEGGPAGIDLSMFYHPETLARILTLRRYLMEKDQNGGLDDLDRWIRMVATNRLTGHSVGFFSVYSLPPNQAASAENQIKINEKRGQTPPVRDVDGIIVKKTRSLVKGLDRRDQARLQSAAGKFLTGDVRATPSIESASVQLLVTSPPFLDIVQYDKDNWLRCWFNGLDAKDVGQGITLSRTVAAWEKVMAAAFAEFFRIIRPGGWVAFEVGEVRNGKVNLDEVVLPLGLEAGFDPVGVLVNQQEFTKTSNIWGVKNNRGGTNTNRVAMFYKRAE